MNRTVFVLGDSVPAPRTDEEAPMAGWGQKIQELLVGPIEVANYARSAMTTRKYYTERFAGLLNRMKPGDIVLLGFGGVDHMIHNGMRYVPVPEYQELLGLFTDYIRSEGGVPVMVTPTARYAFSPTGEVKNTRGEYPRAMAEVAAERGVPLIDLTGITMSLWSRIGPTRLRQYFCWVDAGEHPLHPDGNIDSSHLNHPGAYEVARLVVAGLVERSVLTRADVDIAALMEPEGLPPVSHEFTVQSPESALNYGMGTGGAPGFARPVAGATVGPMTKFSGTAPPGTDYLLFFEQGQYIGGTGVGAAGQWLWRRAVEWTPGEHVIQCVGLRADGCSPTAEQHFQVIAGVSPAVITAPKENKFAGPKVRFAGRTQPGATKVVLMEGGRLIGATAVDEKGEWHFTHAHRWRAGHHAVDVIALFGAQESAPATVRFKVVGIPENSSIRTAGSSREDECGEACNHRPFTGTW
ncbi:GDSL-type esterase/lipase family protein [Streptomyces sp. NBC_00059]|uniref:GDSL-type esterase/lipase family protein n=1 Tax=Streptomyces sp. NBC_00059 TaxID=2975635 RepID=UPI0022560115|nr:GDSL-type esterase/lipase family protein [Streptomyces sp. NBC_00059]MCX5417368.1 GDSL-type esterase/lipase family protein [Streptomyces sp. NBC_00059]